MNSMNRFGKVVRALALLVVAGGFSGSAYAGAGPGPDCTPSVPEIDPGSAAGTVTLLVGGVMTLADRRKSR